MTPWSLWWPRSLLFRCILHLPCFFLPIAFLRRCDFHQICFVPSLDLHLSTFMQPFAFTCAREVHPLRTEAEGGLLGEGESEILGNPIGDVRGRKPQKNPGGVKYFSTFLLNCIIAPRLSRFSPVEWAYSLVCGFSMLSLQKKIQSNTCLFPGF